MEADQIENPRLWKLFILLEPMALKALMLSTVDDAGIVVLNLALDPAAPSRLKALQEAVYASPVLTADFASVNILVQTDQYSLSPLELGSEIARESAEYCCIADETDTLQVQEIVSCQTALAWAADTDMLNFLARTFRNPRVGTAMGTALQYFGTKSTSSNGAKVYAHFGTEHVDVVVFDAASKLLAATTRPAPAATDAAYWILALPQELGLDMAETSVFLCGNATLRTSTAVVLKRFAPNVVPLVIPATATRGGTEILKAPFPLIILPLCE